MLPWIFFYALCQSAQFVFKWFFQTFLCLWSFISFTYSILFLVAGYIMEFFTYWPDESLPSKLHWLSVTPRPENRCVNSVSVKFSRNSNSSCGVLFDIFYLSLYLFVQSDGMVGSSFWCVPTLRYGSFVLWSTLGFSWASTLGGACCLAVSSTLGGSQDFLAGLKYSFQFS